MIKMMKQYKVVIERDEDGYLVASVPALPGCHTQAKTLPELQKRVREAIVLCLEVAERDVVYQKTIQALSYNPTFVGLETVTV